MAKARRGRWRDEHLFALAQAMALDDLEHQKIGACDRQIEAPLGTFAGCHDREAVRPVVRPRKRTRNRPCVDVRGIRHRMTGVDLTAMAGIDEPTALTSISEIGLDIGRWPTVKHFTS
jgi:transposase